MIQKVNPKTTENKNAAVATFTFACSRRCHSRVGLVDIYVSVSLACKIVSQDVNGALIL